MIDWLVKKFIKDPENWEDPAVRERYGLLTGLVGIVLNLLLSAGKLGAGLLTGSISVTADAFNNLSDAGSSVVTLAGFRMAAKQADEDHPFGHGRIEYLAGLIVAAAILLVGVELAKTSVEKILSPEAVSFSWLSAGSLLASILVKLWMSWFNRTLGRLIGSAAMAATAAGSLSPAVATYAVLLGPLVFRFTGYNVDGWVGLLVAVFILRSGWGAAKDTLDPLLGQSPSAELVADIERTVLAHPEISGIHDLIVHDYGPGRSMMSLHAEVPRNADMLEIHDVIDNIERELKEKFHTEAVIHMDPIVTDDPEVVRTREEMETIAEETIPGMTIHDFRMTAGSDHKNLIFDAAVPLGCQLSDQEVASAIARKTAERLGPGYFTVVSVDRAYAPLPPV